MLGDERLLLAKQGVLSREVEVALGDGTVCECRGREEAVAEAVLLDEVLRDDPEDLGPNFADSVNTPVPRSVKRLVRRRVDGAVL